jgi:glutathione S-transferase
MKLFYSPGACSLSPHIVLREAGVDVALERVDLKSKKTEHGADFTTVNPKGQVPTLQLDTGEILTEGPVIVQYISDLNPAAGLTGAPGSMTRWRVLEWLNHITSELHKGFSPLFRPNTPDAYKEIARANLAAKFDALETHMAGRNHLTGDAFTAAFVLGILRGWPVQEIQRRATDIAAFVCTQPGATPDLPLTLTQPFLST